MTFASSILARLTVAFLLSCCCGTLAAQSSRALTLANEYPATSLPGEGDTTFATRIAALTSGRVEIRTVFDAKSGFKSADQLIAVRDGKVDLADSFAGALGVHDAFFLLSSLPFLTTGEGDAKRLYDLARPQYETALARFNQKLLFATPWPPSGIWAKLSMASPMDLTGLKLRTYDATSTEVFTRVGAVPANISFADLIPKLKSGDIDAVLSSGDGGAGRKLWEYLDHFTAIEYAIPLSLVTINLDTWKSLDAETQSAFTAAATETEASQWERAKRRVEENYARMRANKMTIVTDVSPALRTKLNEASAEAIGAWTGRTEPGKAVLERFRAGRR
jgi:TRAP-type C4-dicarboxylate transport system substrate-binding protein